MEIIFTKRAQLKFTDLAEHGLATSEQVENVLKDPERVLKGDAGRLIAQGKLDETHMIRVIYEERQDSLLVITFYPARRRRYES